ncbi:MAG: hypothetical protein GXO78_00980 [Calditrichaeota bacterium]|nr:hypothetical protein [Calditrichota bacterium]
MQLLRWTLIVLFFVVFSGLLQFVVLAAPQSHSPHPHGSCHCGCSTSTDTGCDGGCCGASTTPFQVGICSLTCSCNTESPQFLSTGFKYILPRGVQLWVLPGNYRWNWPISLLTPRNTPEPPEKPPELA